MAVAAIAIALTPSTKLAANYRWTPSQTSSMSDSLDGETLLLARQTPSKLEVSIPCLQAPFPAKETVFATSKNFVNNEALLITGENKTVTLSIAGETILSAHLQLNEKCQIEILYDNHSGFSVKEDSSLLANAPGRFFLFSGFYHSAESTVVPTADVTTFPYAFTPSTIQILFAIVFLFSLSFSIFACYRFKRKSHFQSNVPRTKLNKSIRKISVVSGLATFLLFVFWLIFGPVALDDGWVVQNAQSLIHGTNFRVVHQAWDTRTPSGLVSLWLERLIVMISSQLLWVRFIPFLLVVLTWRISRRLIRSLSDNSTITTISYEIIFSLFAISWLFTTRSEILITFLSLLVLRNVIAFCAKPDIFNLTFTGIISSIAFSIHPSGIIAFAPLLAISPLILRSIRIEKILGFFQVIGAASASASTALFLLIYGWDLHSLQQTSSLWGSYIRRDWSDEIERYRYLFDGGYWDTTARRLTLFIIFSGLILTTMIRKSGLPKQKLIPSQSLLLGILLLSLTQTKWPWHFGTLTVFACVTFALAMHEVRSAARAESHWFWDINSSVILGTSVIGVIVWNSWNLWGIFAIPGKVPQHLLDLTNYFRMPSVWLLFAVSILVMAKFRRPFIRTIGSLSIEILVITVVVFNVALIANAGLGSQSWSLAKQSIRSITDSPSCGLADSIYVSDLWELAPPKLSAALSTESQYSPLYVETESTLSKGQVLRPVLGIGESQFATDWYAVSLIQTNLVLRIDDAISISEIGIQIDEQTDPSGQYITLVVGPISQPVATDSIYLDFGKISALVQGSKFQLIFKTFEPGQNFAISEPLLTDSKLLSHVVTQHHLEAKIDPFYKLFFPCINESALDQGISIKPNLIIGGIPLIGTSPSRYMAEENNFINLKIVWPDEIVQSQTSAAVPPIYGVITEDNSPSDIQLTNISAKNFDVK